MVHELDLDLFVSDFGDTIEDDNSFVFLDAFLGPEESLDCASLIPQDDSEHVFSLLGYSADLKYFNNIP